MDVLNVVAELQEILPTICFKYLVVYRSQYMYGILIAI